MEESTWERDETMRATYPFLFRDEGTWFSRNYMHGIVHVAYACECFDCPEFVGTRRKVVLRGEGNT